MILISDGKKLSLGFLVEEVIWTILVIWAILTCSKAVKELHFESRSIARSKHDSGNPSQSGSLF